MFHWTRRGVLGAIGAMGAGAAHADEDGVTAPSLHALARNKGLGFGAALSARDITDAAYSGLAARECGVIVAENECKWPALHPTDGTFTFETADAMLAWADAQHIAMRGHNLVWHHPRWLPAWINNYDFGANPNATAERLLRTHIETVSAHFRGRMASWDVVNETVDPPSGEMRETVFTQAMGSREAPVALSFEIARASLPGTQLVYNDYMDWNSEAHRVGVLRLLEWFRAHEAPVDALGIQAHIRADDPDMTSEARAAQEREWRNFLDAVSSMNYKMLITEFDVNDQRINADIATRDRIVADTARRFLDVTLANVNVEEVLCWGLTDRRSWLQRFTPREDGAPVRPLPFDAEGHAKPMRTAIAAAFAAAPAR